MVLARKIAGRVALVPTDSGLVETACDDSSHCISQEHLWLPQDWDPLRSTSQHRRRINLRGKPKVLTSPVRRDKTLNWILNLDISRPVDSEDGTVSRDCGRDFTVHRLYGEMEVVFPSILGRSRSKTA